MMHARTLPATAPRRAHRSLPLAALLLTGTALSCVPTAAQAQSNWKGIASEDWFDPNNWAPNGVPNSGTDTVIDTTTPNTTTINGGTAATDDLTIGDAATGNLKVTNGGLLTSSDGFIGSKAGSSGTFSISGTGSTWAIQSEFIIGAAGSGSMTINDGGQVSDDSAEIGYGASSVSSATVDGVGSAWLNASSLNVGGGEASGANGPGGQGTLTISNGAIVTAKETMLGSTEGSTGLVTIKDLGSSLTEGANSSITIGFFGSGTLQLQQGGTATTGDVYVGVESTDAQHPAQGIVTIDGGGSALTVSDGLYIGGAHGATDTPGATGSVSVTAGGLLDVTGETQVGTSAGATGKLSVDGSGSSFVDDGVLTVGVNGGAGTVLISGQATAKTTNDFIGVTAGSTGTLTVDSATLTSSIFDVGDSGTGQLVVKNGGSVTATSLGAADSAGANGTITIDGAGTGAEIDVAGAASIGGDGTGILSIKNGGILTDSAGYVGVGTGTGSATIDGAGSAWSTSTALNVGYTGAGTLNVQNGATATSDTGLIGEKAGSVGTVNVTGAGSSWKVTDELDIGNLGKGTMTISAGGVVTAPDTFVGTQQGATGTLTVTGPGSMLTSTDVLGVGTDGIGTLSITNGGVVKGAIGEVGTYNMGNGTVTVDGAGSRWDNSDLVAVGDYGVGKLTLSNGGAFTALSLIAGYNSGTGTISVQSGSTVNASGISIGDGGTGTLNVSGGGTVTVDFSEVGETAGLTGTATVDGAGSSWVSNGELRIGDLGTGTLTISNGGSVTSNGDAYVGQANGSSGTVDLSGTGSSLTVTDGLAVGYDGRGAVVVSNGATLNTPGGMALGVGSDGVGSLSIGADYASAAAAPGTVNASTIIFGSGIGLLDFNHTSQNYTFSSVLTGLGTIDQYAGVTHLTADSNGFTGGVNVTGGTLLIDGNLGGANAAIVQGGGTLGGTGSIGGNVVVYDGTLLGVEGQTLTFNNLALTSGSNINVSLDTPGGATLFNVTGNLQLDGTLNISSAGAFGPGVYSLFTYGGVLTPDGLAIGTVPSGTSASDYTIQTGVAGQVNLASTANTVLNFWDGDATGSANNNAVDGGTGTWTATSANWTDANGTQNGAMHPQPGFAIFQNPGGVVTVDASAGDIAVTGMQFAANGYVVYGDAIALADPDSKIRVGDGSSAGANYVATIGSALTGAGGLEKTDLGTLILTADNDYSGGTTISGGMLVLGGGGTTGSVTGDIVDNGALAFMRSDVFGYSGVISGTGYIVQGGPGGVTLTGVNTFTGVTQILEGTLALSGDGSIAASSGVAISQGGTFDISATTAGASIKTLQGAGIVNLGAQTLTLTDAQTVFDGVIGGSGGLTVTGGTEGLGGVNTYTGKTTIAGGVLALGDSGSIAASSGVAVAQSAVFDISQTTSGASIQTLSGAGDVNLGAQSLTLSNASDQFDGVIAGTGNLVVTGGTETLTGVNSYTGATQLLGGTLALTGSGSIAASGGVSIFQSGKFDISGTTAGASITTLSGPGGSVALGAQTLTITAAADEFDGSIAGSGGLVVAHGDEVLGGVNSYTGGTTIDAGAALELQAGGSILGDVKADGVLVFDRDAGLTFGGTISGAGGVVQEGTGTVTLTGVNTYTGGTDITSGTLVGSATSFGTGPIEIDGALVIDQPSDASFANILGGAGSFTKQGAGILTVTGNSGGYFTGATTVASGRLSVNGSLATSVVTVKSGANLGGNGVVGGVIAESGSTIAPGNSIGLLHVAGNYSQASGSTYQVELTSTGQADRIDVTGTATIANGAILSLTKLDAAPYVFGTQYKVLDAAGGISGTYTLAGNTQLSAFMGLVLAYDANDVYLDVAKVKSFASAGSTRNQTDTGAGLDSLPTSNAIVDAVVVMPDNATADAAFDQLSGEIHASAKTTMLEDSRLVRDAALGRLLSGQGGGLWGTYTGSWATNDGDGNAATLTRNASSFVVGVDASPAKGLTVGVLGGYAKSNARVPARNSSAKIDSYTAGFYAGADAGRAKIRIGGAYSWQTVDTNRSVAFAGFSDKLSAKYSARTAQAFGDIGYTIGSDRLNVEPFAQAAWIDVATDAFTETGGAAALKADKQSRDLGVVTLGLRGVAGFTIGGAAARFHATAGWREATGDRTPDASLSFASGGNAFDIAGAPIAKNSALLDTGIDVALTPRLRLNIGYVGQLASHTRDNGVKAGISMAF